MANGNGGRIDKLVAALLVLLVSVNIGLTIKSLVGQAELNTEVQVLSERLDGHMRYTGDGGS